MANETPHLAPISMNSQKIINTAKGVDDYDVVVKKQLDEHKFDYVFLPEVFNLTSVNIDATTNKTYIVDLNSDNDVPSVVYYFYFPTGSQYDGRIIRIIALPKVDGKFHKMANIYLTYAHYDTENNSITTINVRNLEFGQYGIEFVCKNGKFVRVNYLYNVAGGSGGSSLPTGLENQTLRHNGTDWEANSEVQIKHSAFGSMVAIEAEFYANMRVIDPNNADNVADLHVLNRGVGHFNSCKIGFDTDTLIGHIGDENGSVGIELTEKSDQVTPIFKATRSYLQSQSLVGEGSELIGTDEFGNITRMGSGSSTDEKVKAGATDDEAGYLIDKLSSADGSVTITEDTTNDKIDLSVVVGENDTYEYIYTNQNVVLDENSANILEVHSYGTTIDVVLPEYTIGKYKYVIYNKTEAFDIRIVAGTDIYRLQPFNKIELYNSKSALHKYITHYKKNIVIGNDLNENLIDNFAVIGNKNTDITTSNVLGENNDDVTNSLVFGNDNSDIINSITIGSDCWNNGLKSIAVGDEITNCGEYSSSLGYKSSALAHDVALGSFARSWKYGNNRIITTGNTDESKRTTNWIVQNYDTFDFDNSTSTPRKVAFSNVAGAGELTNILGFLNIVGQKAAINFTAKVNCVVIEVPNGREADLDKVKSWKYDGVAIYKASNDITLKTNPIADLLYQDSGCEDLDNLTIFFSDESNSELTLKMQTNVGMAGYVFRLNAVVEYLETRW
jgi:hypothetical protein